VQDWSPRLILRRWPMRRLPVTCGKDGHGESLASKTIRPNDTVALTSVGYVDSVIIVGTTYRLVATWTNVPCP
jgi:hypothetical protein